MHYLLRAVFLWPLLTAGCASPSPEQVLRELVADAEAATEARDTGYFRALISERYTDRGGRNRATLIDALRAYFLTHARVEAVTRIDTIEFFGDDAATVALDVGLVTHAGEALLGGWDGNLRRVELELVREGGEWRLIGSSW